MLDLCHINISVHLVSPLFRTFDYHGEGETQTSYPPTLVENIYVHYELGIPLLSSGLERLDGSGLTHEVSLPLLPLVVPLSFLAFSIIFLRHSYVSVSFH